MYCNQIIVGSQTVDIVSTLEGTREDPSEETVTRIKELGLERLSTYRENNNAAKFTDLLEKRFLEKSSHLKKRQIRYKKKDVLNSLDFLEIFCLLAAQKNLISGKNMASLEKNRDNTIINAVRKIEEIRSQVGSSSKKSIKKLVADLNQLIDKIFSRNLTPLEQNATAKSVKKAQIIITKGI